ncbi:MAG: HlyD family type I secretion periplasmic adaptor subunit [Geminicoccaceae bacterium]
MAVSEFDFRPGHDEGAGRTASPVAGLLVVVIAVLLAGTVGWMAWAEVDEVVRAGGRIEPANGVKLVNHPAGGRVARLHVRDGDTVAEGEPLVTFDPEVGEGEHAELLGRWQARAMETARLEAEAAGAPAIAAPPELAAARPDLVDSQQRLMDARRASLAGEREALTRSVQAREGELDSAAAEQGRLRNSLVLFRQQLDAVKELASRGLYPQLKLIAVEREVGDTAGELKKAGSALAAAQAALGESRSRLAALDSQWHSDVLAELARITAERDRLGEELRVQETRLQAMVVRAPVAGIVEAVAVTGSGQAFGPNDPLMKLVPLGEGLVVEARVANEDIGRIRPGMAAVVKVRAYDYLRWGTLSGSVRKVASDAVPDPKGGTLLYPVTVETDRQQLGDNAAVVPGMLVDVEIEVGRRTILGYLTDRILRAGDGAFEDG